MGRDDDRILTLTQCFAQRFGHRPHVVARAPGRVNLIGEHTDYNGLPVLPMAVDRTVLVAGAPREDARIELANLDPAFPPRSYELAPVIPPFPPGDWGNYHKAAVQGLVSLLRPAALGGGDFLVAGNIPAGAGLSSSAALLVGSALALLAVHDRNLSVRDCHRLAEVLHGFLTDIFQNRPPASGSQNKPALI